MKLFFCSILFCASVAPFATANVAADQPVTLAEVDVSASRDPAPTGGNQFPGDAASIPIARIRETINLIDTEDAVKYFPSIFLRKRNYGDTQPVMATRTWGVSSSARSLVYADGVLLTALIANNNNIGAPRWGLVAPLEIARIDVLYGPFSALYPGNSMGAVMEISTRLPEKFEAVVEQSLAWQSFHLYGSRNTYATSQTSAEIGDRIGKFSCWVSANYLDSYSQPLSFVTASAFPSGTTGGYSETNKLGAAADVVGAGGLLHTRMTNAKVKAAYDITPVLRAIYTVGVWENAADSTVQTYLTNAAGQATFAGLSGFASGYYSIIEEHSAHSLLLKSNSRANWDFTAGASIYRFDKDNQRTPSTASATTASALGFGPVGKVAVLGGTGWSTFDLQGTWRSNEETMPPGHIVTAGIHDDRQNLYNPTFNTPDWQAGGPYGSVATEGDGKTHTQALFAQDSWHLLPPVTLTYGLRYEEWQAYDGLNINGATTVFQPRERASRFSPKAALNLTREHWVLGVSAGRAYRFATPAELYQLVSTSTTYTSPNPNLKPDNDFSTELKIERDFDRGLLRLAVFQDNVHDAIISQFNPLVPGSAQLYSFVSNVDHVRATGVELTGQADHALWKALSVSGSITYLDARTLALSGRASATADPAAALGRFLPNIPEWRGNLVVTYRSGERWSITVAGRYSGKLWTTLDNTDIHPNTYQGFAPWFVADTHWHLLFNKNWAASLGVDNLFNRKYFIFHPFPQRTFLISLKWGL